MEQKLLELTKENNLLRNRLKQQQQQQLQQQQELQQEQHQQQQEQQERQSLPLVPSVAPDTVILSAAERKDTAGASMPKVPSLPVSSVETFSANLANVIRPPPNLPAVFPTHLFAATPLLATAPGSIPPSIFPPSGTAPTPLLTRGSASASLQVTASAVQQLPALQICTLQAALQQVQQVSYL